MIVQEIRKALREANDRSPGATDLQATQPKQAPIQKAGKPSKKALDQYKVRQFFKKLESSDTLMQLMTFTTPLQQAQAIVKFAELVGVPEGRIPVVVQQLRALSKHKDK